MHSARARNAAREARALPKRGRCRSYERLIFGNQAEQAVFFISDACGEIDATAKRQQIPQAIKLQRSSIGTANCSEESARRRIVIIDPSIAEIADPEFVAFHQGKS